MKESKKVNKTIKKEVKVKVTECSEGLSDVRMGEKSLIDICTDADEAKKEIMKNKTKDLIKGLLELKEYFDTEGILQNTSHYIGDMSTLLGTVVSCDFCDSCEYEYNTCDECDEDCTDECDDYCDDCTCDGDCTECLSEDVYSEVDEDEYFESPISSSGTVMVELPFHSILSLKRFIEDALMGYISEKHKDLSIGFVCNISKAYETFCDVSDFIIDYLYGDEVDKCDGCTCTDCCDSCYTDYKCDSGEDDVESVEV